MKENVRDHLQMRLRRAAVAVFAIGTAAAGTVHAGPLYIEQNQGARLATFDVIDPVHIKGEGSVHLDAPESFDFVSPRGNQAELVRFRQGQEDTVLTLPHPISDAGTNAFTVTSPTMNAPPALYFGAIDTVLSYELNRLFDVKQVRAQMTRSDTGSTFMLTENGSYVIRRPAVEWIHQLMVIPPN